MEYKLRMHYVKKQDVAHANYSNQQCLKSYNKKLEF